MCVNFKDEEMSGSYFKKAQKERRQQGTFDLK